MIWEGSESQPIVYRAYPRFESSRVCGCRRGVDGGSTRQRVQKNQQPRPSTLHWRDRQIPRGLCSTLHPESAPPASRGTLYSDHIVLQQGQSELMSSGSFQLQAIGLHVVPGAPHSRGVVSVKPGNTIEVASPEGNFGVSNDSGVMLANILPGHSFSFAMQAAANSSDFSGVGLVTFDNGTYYLTTDPNVRYILNCKDAHSFVGNKVVVTGTLQGGAARSGGMLCVKTMDINGPTSTGSKKK